MVDIQDLHRRSYRIQPEIWLLQAVTRGDRELARSLARRLQGAPAVPSGFSKLAFQLAPNEKDRSLVVKILNLYNKIFWVAPDGDITALARDVRGLASQN